MLAREQVEDRMDIAGPVLGKVVQDRVRDMVLCWMAVQVDIVRVDIVPEGTVQEGTVRQEGIVQ